MRILTFIFVIFLLFSNQVLAQEDLEIITYYPAPIGVFKDIRADLFKDLTSPNNYFLDLDSRSKIKALNISVPIDNTVQKSLLQVGGTLAADSSDRATGYFRNIGWDKIGICGETVNAGLAGNSFGVYGYAHSTNKVNIGVYGIAEGNVIGNNKDYGIEGQGAGYGSEIGVAGFGDSFGVLVNTGKNEGIDSSLIGDIYSGIFSYSATQHGLYSNVFNVGSSYHAGYFRGYSGAPALEARSDGRYGIYGKSDFDFAGYFRGNRGAVKIYTYISRSLSTQTNQSYAAEIIGNDNELVLTMDSGAFGRYNYTGYMYVRAPDGKEARFGAATLIEPLSSIYLVSFPDYLIWYNPWGEDLYFTYNRAFITSTHPIVINPGEGVLADRYINFNGNVYVKGAGVHVSDLSEPFNLINEDNLESGDVVVIDDTGKSLRKSDKPYDPHAAGVISSKEQSAVIIGYNKKQSIDKPVALAGQVLCKVDASYNKIQPGDLLTTSQTPGHAMKAMPVMETDSRNIYPTGAIIGVALEPLDKGKGKILISLGLE